MEQPQFSCSDHKCINWYTTLGSSLATPNKVEAWRSKRVGGYWKNWGFLFLKSLPGGAIYKEIANLRLGAKQCVCWGEGAGAGGKQRRKRIEF